jgi:hypothetical protein
VARDDRGNASEPAAMATPFTKSRREISRFIPRIRSLFFKCACILCTVGLSVPEPSAAAARESSRSLRSEHNADSEECSDPHMGSQSDPRGQMSPGRKVAGEQ